MDARKTYVKKRNILIACLLTAAAVLTLLFVFLTAGGKAPEEAIPETTATAVPEPERAALWNDGLSFSGEIAEDTVNNIREVLYYGNTRLGVTDGTVLAEPFEEDLCYLLGEDCLPDLHVYIKNEQTTERSVTRERLLDRALSLALSEEADACGLYVKNSFVGAVANEQTAEKALDAFLAAAAEKSSYENATAELRGVSFRDCSVVKSDLLDMTELEALLAKCCDEQLEFSGVDYEKINNYAAEIALPEDSYVIVSEKEQVDKITIPYVTKEVYDHDLYAGYKKVTQEGKNGLATRTYKLRYENGTLVSKELIGEKTVTEMVQRVVVYGDKQYLLWPLSFPDNMRITSPYGYRTHPIYKTTLFHSGVDIAGPSSGDIFGDNIYAALDGVVTVAVNDRGSTGYGTYVVIEHGKSLIEGKTVSTLYAHCDKLYVKEGQKVKKGDLIAVVGTTGASTGPHLHFEVLVNGMTTDPLSYSFIYKVNGAPFDPMKYVTKAY